MSANQGRSALPEREAPPPALAALLDWLRAEPEGWDEPARLKYLVEHFAEGADADYAFAARIHDAFRPPPVVRIVASAVRRPPGCRPDEAVPLTVGCFDDGFARLAAGEVLDTADMGALAPGAAVHFAGLLVPVMVEGTLWGVLGLTDGGRPVLLGPTAREAVERIAAALGQRLASAAGDAARSSDRLLGTALDLIAEPLAVYSGDLRLVRYNRAWREMLPHVRPGEEVHGIALLDIFRAHVDRGLWTLDFADEMFRDLASGRLALNSERIAHIGGRYKRSRASPMPDGGFVTIHDDINDLVERQRELVAAKEEAELASRAKSTFLANISHELRTPLNAIIGFSDVMLREIFGALPHARYREYAQDIHDSGNLLLSLINDILDMARIEAGKVDLKPQPIAIDGVLREVGRMVALRAEAKSQRLQIVAPDGLPPVMADRRATIQILLNLVGNAIKFTPSSGAITIGVVPEGAELRIQVQDTGPGIDSSLMARIGRPFEQADNFEIDTTRENQGTGLGLAIARALVERQGGRFMVESEPGQGATVAFTLPVVGRQ